MTLTPSKCCRKPVREKNILINMSIIISRKVQVNSEQVSERKERRRKSKAKLKRGKKAMDDTGLQEKD